MDTCLFAHAQDGMHRGLQLEDVLRRLDDEEIAAAVSQPAHLVEEEIDDLAEAMVSQERVLRGGKQSRRADRAGHVSRLIGAGVAVGHPPRQRGGLAVDVIGPLAKAVFRQLQLAAAERVRFDDVDADLEKRCVDLLDEPRVVQHEVFIAAFDAAVASGIKVVVLDGGAHRTVEDDDPIANEIEIRWTSNCTERHGGKSLLTLRPRV